MKDADDEPTGRVTKSVHFPLKDWAEVERAVKRFKRTGAALGVNGKKVKPSESGYFSAVVIRQAREDNAAEDAKRAQKNGDTP